ncbi:hypothetical protein [Tautonia marina]|nr:hypothetical protein [Tautonia marina]
MNPSRSARNALDLPSSGLYFISAVMLETKLAGIEHFFNTFALI